MSLQELALLGALAVGVLFVLAILCFPQLLVYFVLLTAPLASLLHNLEEFHAAGTTVTLSGIRWVSVFALILLILLLSRRLVLPRYFIPIFLFGGWMACRWLAAGGDSEGMKDVLYYLLAPLIGVYTLTIFSAQPQHRIQTVRSLILWSPFIPLLMYVVAFPAGLVEWTPNGPKGLIGPRPIATYLLIALAVALARWRYNEGVRQQRHAQLMALLAFGIIVFTASRVATVVALILVVVFRTRPRNLWKALPRVVWGGALALVLLLLIPQLRSRLFYWTPTSPGEVIEALDLSGRHQMWTTTLEHALEQPLVGWGPGRSRPLVAAALNWRGRDVPPKEYPPHNEYLQVFHDGGLVGLLLLLLGWGALAKRYLQGWIDAHRAGDRNRSEWFLASILGIGIILVSSMATNTLHYTMITGPTFILLACSARLDRGATRGLQNRLTGPELGSASIDEGDAEFDDSK